MDKIALTILGAVISSIIYYVLPILIDHIRNVRNPAFSGTWHSSWQPNNDQSGAWVSEMVDVTLRLGKLRLKNQQGESGYDWVADGKIIKGKYIVGSIRSLKPGALSTGTFILLLSPQGEFISGYVAELNDKDQYVFGAWVLGRKPENVDDAQKKLYNERPRLPKTQNAK